MHEINQANICFLLRFSKENIFLAGSITLKNWSAKVLFVSLQPVTNMLLAFFPQTWFMLLSVFFSNFVIHDDTWCEKCQFWTRCQKKPKKKITLKFSFTLTLSHCNIKFSSGKIWRTSIWWAWWSCDFAGNILGPT